MKHNRKKPRGECARCKRVMCVYARRLCQRCYIACVNNDTLWQWPRKLQYRDEILNEWLILRKRKLTWREAANELGMSHIAFDRAMWRAIKDGDPRALKPLVDRRNQPISPITPTRDEVAV